MIKYFGFAFTLAFLFFLFSPLNEFYNDGDIIIIYGIIILLAFTAVLIIITYLVMILVAYTAVLIKEILETKLRNWRKNND